MPAGHARPGQHGLHILQVGFGRLFENNPLIKNKNFWVSPFFKKVTSFEAFYKKLHQKLL
ncbi:hypothetical protein [Novacetimonas pomaceti]|uniref:hypothetical protein n=1 Tax=Novacetimonas pomaceti TaxID=2021998 RepID=UPI00140295CB|nr:hypothetical protein [Novacetimonas pomaceti]